MSEKMMDADQFGDAVDAAVRAASDMGHAVSVAVASEMLRVAIASQPVGVQDGPFLGDALLMWNRRHDNPPIKVGYEYGVADALLQMIAAPAAPTVKAEQVQCSTCNDTSMIGDLPIECPDCCYDAAPSLPAAGLAVEEVSSFRLPDSSDFYGFGYVDGTCIQSLRGVRDHLEDLLDAIPGEPLMTVAQHERIDGQRLAVIDHLRNALRFYADGDHMLLADPDAWDTCSGEPVNFLHDEAGTASVEDGSIAKLVLSALSAQQSAPERVSVPVELAERMAVPAHNGKGWTTWNAAVAYEAAKELRALLSGAREGGI